MWFSAGEFFDDPQSSLPPEQTTETSLWERLGKAAMLDIESSSFSWDMLSSLHHTEHSSSTEHSEDEMNKALEVCDLLCYSVYIDILSEFMSVCQNLKNELPLKRIFEKNYAQTCLFAYLLPQFLFNCVHIGHCKFWGSCLLCPIQPAWEL